MKKQLFLLPAVCLAFFLFPASLSLAQTLPSLLVSGDAAATGLAGAAVAAPANAFVLENNPAAMALSPDQGAGGASFGLWQPGAAADKVLSAGGYLRLGSKLAVGLTGKIFNQPSYDVTSANGVVSQIGGAFTPQEMSFGAGLAYALTDHLSLGVTGRMVSSSLAEEAKASAISLDAGLLYSQDALRAGLTVAHLGGKVTYEEDGYAQPTVVKAGGAYEIIPGLTGNLEADYFLGGGFNAKIGAAWQVAEIATLRAGYNAGASNAYLPSFASLGAGLHLSGLRIDLSWLTANKNLGNSLCIGASYAF